MRLKGKLAGLGIRAVGPWLLAAALAAAAGGAPPAASPAPDPRPPLDLGGALRGDASRRAPLVDLRRGPVEISGRVLAPPPQAVLVRVTTSLGSSALARVPVEGGSFRCRYPGDFREAPHGDPMTASRGALQEARGLAPPLAPSLLFIDATADADFDVWREGHFQAEAAVIVYDGSTRRLPDFPSAFTSDLLDARGRVDRECAEWPVIRTLANLYLHSQAARAAGIARRGFDLDRPDDLRTFKDRLSLYDFDHRDRDWSSPLGHRPRRTFWQAVWNAWFHSGNDDPIDGNDANNDPRNFVPYAFANDFSDTLILYLLRQRDTQPLDDNLRTICHEGIENLLAMQHRGQENFALADWRGHRETYTAGAFRYGMFESGEFLTEKKGWFYNPQFLDYAGGGVFNGRAVWALGEALKHEPDGPLEPRLKEALALALKFCLSDGLAHGYAKRTRAGNVYWRDAGEHGYLMVGMLAAAAVAPGLPVTRAAGGKGSGGGASSPTIPLREACAAALDALVDLEEPHRQWSVYPNVDALAIIALADGAAVLRDHPRASAWRDAASRAADAWLEAKVDPAEGPRDRASPQDSGARSGAAVHFGLRIAPGRMTFNWRRLSERCDDRNVIHLYVTGHWIHALARLYAVTGEDRYRIRAEAMVRYLCGENPWHARLLCELGGVYNWVDDTDGDGVEDRLKMDMYPESTAFCQIGIHQLIRALWER